jgi:hypothetical protein
MEYWMREVDQVIAAESVPGGHGDSQPQSGCMLL